MPPGAESTGGGDPGTNLPGSGGNKPGSPGGTPSPGDVGTVPKLEPVYFRSATRRLTRTELRQVLQDLLGLDLETEIAKFPEDFAEAGEVFAFDNKYTLQQPSASLIEAAKNLADAAGARLGEDAALRARLVPCKPTGPGDEACLRTFVETFGRRALRRPLAADEVAGYVTKFKPFSVEANDFYRAPALITRVLLQDMEFLYRVEVGTPVPGTPALAKLSGPEVASRLSFFLWGTAPDDALLGAAAAGDKLQTPEAVRLQAAKMLADSRAQHGVQRFHAMWLGYERQPPPAELARPMLEETNALIDKVVLRDKGPWLDLFRAKETQVNAALAAHYGLPKPAGAAGSVDYGQSGRQGILSHGTFLGVERKHQDTSPTMRGHFIRTRLLCQVIPPPPPTVTSDTPPTEGSCKTDRYSMWKQAGCDGCHRLMDPIGHGLENFDHTGKFRTLAPDDAGKSNCTIKGEGTLAGGADGAFTGVAGLADRLVESGELTACLTTQLASFYLGREIDAKEEATFQKLAERFRASNHRFDQMLLDFVSLPGFGYRLAE